MRFNNYTKAAIFLFVGLVLIKWGGAFTNKAAATQAAALSSGDHHFEIQVENLDRRYTVHVPPKYDGKTPCAVVIMLHGGGGTGRAAAFETQWSKKADQEGFLVVYPDALPPNPSHPPHFSRNPQMWNDGSDRLYSGQKPADDIAFLNAMLDDLHNRFSVDATQVFVTGFSNGAGMAFRMASELSARVAAIAPVAGASWIDPLVLERPVPVLYITGTADPLNRIEGGTPKLATGGYDKVRAKPKPPVRESILKWVKALNCSESLRETAEQDGVRIERYGSGRDGTEVVYIAVEGLGHTWAGGKSLLPESMVGQQSSKISATDVIWEFFKKHSSRGGLPR